MFLSKTVKESPKKNANKFPGKSVGRSLESPVRIYRGRSVRMFQDKYATKCQNRNARTFPVRSAEMYHDRAAKMFQSKTAQLFTSVQFVHNQAISQHQHIRDRLIVTDLNHFPVQCTQSYHVTHTTVMAYLVYAVEPYKYYLLYLFLLPFGVQSFQSSE